MLGNFTYCNPTRIHFGADALNHLSDELAKYGETILLAYGGGSIKKSGLYGGGSVCDYAKALSVSAYCDEDPWDKYYLRMEDADNEIIPVGCILTMVGTGSEMNGGAVITNHKQKLKIGHVFGENVFPKFSILNPEYTFTLPKYQMVAGFYDIMNHITEQYFSDTDDCTSDYVMEGLMKSLIHSSRIAVENPRDYEEK